MNESWRGSLTTLAAAAVWLALAAWRPSTTFHLAPAVLVAAWAVTERLTGDRPLTRARAAVVCSAGVGAALIMTAVLAAAGWLSGPALLGGSALAETLIVLAFSAPLIWLAVSWHRSLVRR